MSTSLHMDAVRSVKISKPIKVDGIGWQRSIVVNFRDGTYTDIMIVGARENNLIVENVENIADGIEG